MSLRMPTIEKRETDKKFYIAPFAGYGITDGQKVGYGIRLGAVFENQVKFGLIVTNHHGTEKSSDGNWGYEEIYKKAFYAGAELGYAFRLNAMSICPYLTAGYVSGDYYEEWQDGSTSSEVGPIYGGAGLVLDFNLSNRMSIGPDLRFTIGAPDVDFAGFLVLGFSF